MERIAILVFALSAGLIGWVLLGYPLILGLAAHLRRRRVQKQPLQTSVSFILPVHNGGDFLASKLRSILELDYPRHLMEIIVVSDGSADRTDAIAESFSSEGVRLIRLPRGGKARALNHALAAATGEILVFTDVRQHLEHDSLQRLLECFADAEIGVVSANLLIRRGERIEESDIGLYRKYEAWIRTRLSAYRSVLGASGCYYAMRRRLARPLPEDTLLDDVYLPLCAIFAGYRCILEPSARCYDYPTALDSEFRRKVRTQAGVYQLIRFFPALLACWTPLGFHFVSLKLGRLLLPFAFLLLLISSFGLPQPWNGVALLLQSGFYLAAGMDVLTPERSFLKRFTSPFRSFLVLIASALFAVSIFFVPPQALWRQTMVRKSGSRAA
jgi:cellulose synthase/poly-beta-1,6-N-acetylglucosamine synthase-like glycosyltransferase